MRPQRDRRRRGFTLMEVLLVMVILVILASFAVFQYTGTQRQAQISQAKSQIGLFKTPLEMFKFATDNFPTTAQGLDALIVCPPDVDPGKWDSPYLTPNVPLDPWYQPYQYQCPGQRNPDSYDVWTVSPDGVEIGNWTQ